MGMEAKLPIKAGPTSTFRWVRLRLLILAAAVIHVSVTTSVFLVGKFGLMPSQFGQSGLGNFALDGFFYESEVFELCGVLKKDGVIAWATWPTQLHLRPYALALAVLNGGASFNILTIEPVNLIYYLAILVMVFKLGEIVFNYRTGLVAAATVAVWPSFLLHTTQLLRDPLLVVAVLMLMLTLTLCLKRDFVWHRGILIGVAGMASILLIRIVRLPMWPVLWVIVVLTVLFLVIRLIRQRRFAIGNVAFAVMMITAMAMIPRFQNTFHNQQAVNRPRNVNSDDVQAMPVTQQIVVRRQGFQLRRDSADEPIPSEGGSDIDTGVHFKSVIDIIRHVPRAVVVGFLAPFPNMWFGNGKEVGVSGRLLAGFETLMTYMIECLALFGLWRARKDLSAWLLFLVVTVGAVALGLVVTNIGALFRLRYSFWMLLLILGAGGADYLLGRGTRAASMGGNFISEQPAGTFHS